MLCRHAGGDGSAWRERVRQAEDLGFDALLVSDHLDDQSAPIPALGAAAMVSSALRLGTLVLSNPFRLSDEEGRGSPHLLVGPKGAVVERAHRFRERFGISFLVVSELDATRFAPAIEELRHR